MRAKVIKSQAKLLKYPLLMFNWYIKRLLNINYKRCRSLRSLFEEWKKRILIFLT